MGASEAAIVNRSSEAAVVAAFEQHRRRVFRAAYRITGNVQDAEDVLQTVFLAVLKRDAATTPGSAIGDESGSYLARSAINGALDVLRSRKRVAELDPEATQQAREADEHAGDAAENAVWRAELRTRLRSALSGLPPNWAEIVALRYFEGYGNTEIATLLGTSSSVIAVTLHRARLRLRAALSGQSFTEKDA